jgi:hypothetical protein
MSAHLCPGCRGRRPVEAFGKRASSRTGLAAAIDYLQRVKADTYSMKEMSDG